jgi:hypothetical protein
MGVGTLADVIGLSTKRAPSARALGYDPAIGDRPSSRWLGDSEVCM